MSAAEAASRGGTFSNLSISPMADRAQFSNPRVAAALALGDASSVHGGGARATALPPSAATILLAEPTVPSPAPSAARDLATRRRSVRSSSSPAALTTPSPTPVTAGYHLPARVRAPGSQRSSSWLAAENPRAAVAGRAESPSETSVRGGKELAAMEAIQPVSDPITRVLSERMNPMIDRPAFPDGWSITSEDSPSLTPRLLSIKSNSSTESYFEGSGRMLSRSNRHISATNAEINYTEYLDLMKLEVDTQLDKLKGDVTGLENYALPDNGYTLGTHLGMSLDVMLIEIDERFNALKLLLAVIFRQARKMPGLANPLVTDLQWEHELQLEVVSITIGEYISGLQEELERKLYEQISVTNTMSKNWQEAIAQFATMRKDLGALSKLMLPSVPESHISHSKNESSGNRSNRWKYNLFGKKPKEDHSSSRAGESKSFRKQKSMVISEKSDFRHLNDMTKDETIRYFKSEISKLKRTHELALQEKTEELFKFKREKGSLALQNDVEFEPLRKKIPEIISRMDQIISKNIKIPALCMTHDELDEKCRLTSRIDSLYYDNQHLRGLLADNRKDVKELSSQLSEASRDLSQLSSEEELLRRIERIKEESEDLRIEGDVRDGLYHTVTRNLLDHSMSDMHDAALNFNAKLSSLEAVMSEKEKALCLSNEENRKLKEKLSKLEKECMVQSHQEDPEVIKQESAEMILRDIEVEPHTSPGRSHEAPKQDLQYDELIKLNCSNITKNDQEKQLECILVSIMKLSKEFVEIEQKLSTERTENRSEELTDHCSHMVRQAVVLTKIGLWYKQMLERRRSELQKAEAKVVILGDKVNAHLSLLQKIYDTLDHYSPTLQQYPGLLEAFMKTCKLVAGLRSRQTKDDTI